MSSKRAGRLPTANKADLAVPARKRKGRTRGADEAPRSLPKRPRAGRLVAADKAGTTEPARTNSRARARARKAMLQLPSTRAGLPALAETANHAAPARTPSASAGSSMPLANGQVPTPRAGQKQGADEAVLPVPARARAGRSGDADEARDGLPARGDAGQAKAADKAIDRVPASPLFEQLAELQVRRRFYIALVNRQMNAAKALARRYLGWRSESDEAERERINGEATKLVAQAMAAKGDGEIEGPLAADLFVVKAAIAPLQVARQSVEAEAKRLVRGVPVYQWASGVRGFGDLGLAVILGEAGDLARYPKKGHVWKRLGLAPHDGKAYSTWRRDGGLTADDWIAAGYSPRRRAEMYAVIGEPLFKHQTIISGPYRAIYDRRRAATAVSQPEWTKSHSHMDALRIMTKALVRDLWQQMRRAGVLEPNRADRRLPAAPTGHSGGAAMATQPSPVGNHRRASDELPPAVPDAPAAPTGRVLRAAEAGLHLPVGNSSAGGE